jgi:hypothetical protein
VGPIKLDGLLDEPSWGQAQALELTQQSPRPGVPTEFPTQVFVLADKDNVYFGFRCADPGRAPLAVHTLRRDGAMDGDDSVTVVLDPFGDRRNGYFFRINAAAARQDGLISVFDKASYDWDGIWDGRVARTPEGWSAEIVIPARTLNFTKNLDRWGVNFERFVAVDRISLRWNSPTLDSFLTDMSRAGSLKGVEQLKQGLGLEFSPYLVGRTSEAFRQGGRVWQVSPGIDAIWRITPQLAAVFTANTDFAETEVDSRRVNTTRFPLFFPERRQFFLEGASQFSFGLGLDTCTSSRLPCFIPFFSRRVGLSDGRPIPIDAGAKLIGRLGNWNVAALNVKTRDSQFAPGTNLFVGRLSYDLSKEVRVGGIVTYGDPSGRKRNGLFAVDGAWRTSRFRGNKNLQAGVWAAKSIGDLPEGSTTGYGINLNYPNDLWACYFDAARFGNGLNPALGFLPRLGISRLDTGCVFKPRPRRDGQFRWIRQYFYEMFYTRVDNVKGYTESWRFFTAPMQFRAESGDRMEFNWAPQYEFLKTPFEVTRGVVIPPGPHRFTRWRIEAESSPTRPWEVGSTNWFGTFYNGTLLETANFVRWTSPKGLVQLGVTADNNFGSLPGVKFAQRLWSTQATVAWSPNLSLSAFIQYDTASLNLGSNARVRWILKPGTDVFLVWNRGWQRILHSPSDLNLVPDRDSVTLKVRWTFRR